MKAMLAAFAVIALIAIGANVILDQVGFSSAERGTGSAVRLDN